MPRKSVFPYPGAKSYLATWIIDYFPDHWKYVEVFGGSASVLIHKPRSTFEVYNDLDGDVHNFFEVLRDRTDDLVEFLTPLEYSEHRYHAWAERRWGEETIDDPVERAGIFFYLQLSSIHSNTNRPSGMKTSAVGSPAKTFTNARALLSEYAERFEGVVIHNRDYEDLIGTHGDPPASYQDRGDILFYFDPPYPDAKEYYYSVGSDFDHQEFADVLRELEARWVVSYESLPGPIADLVDEAEEEYHVAKKAVRRPGTNTDSEGAREVYERLVMNYDPGQVPKFVDRDQRTLAEVGDD